MYRQCAYERATPLLEESLALRRALAHVAYRQGDAGRAGSLYGQGLALARDLGDRRLTAYGLEGLASVAAVQRRAAHAAQLFGAAEALRETVGVPLAAAERAIYDPAVKTTRAALSGSALAAAWSAGRALPQAEAIALALDWMSHRDRGVAAGVGGAPAR